MRQWSSECVWCDRVRCQGCWPEHSRHGVRWWAVDRERTMGSLGGVVQRGLVLPPWDCWWTQERPEDSEALRGAATSGPDVFRWEAFEWKATETTQVWKPLLGQYGRWKRQPWVRDKEQEIVIDWLPWGIEKGLCLQVQWNERTGGVQRDTIKPEGLMEAKPSIKSNSSWSTKQKVQMDSARWRDPCEIIFRITAVLG